MSDDELVLGVAREALMPGGSWRGVLVGSLDGFLESIDLHGTFRRRGDVETDPSWKQVIPYLVLMDRGRLFLMRRTRAGSDRRLHERWSIGVGGHVNPEDRDIEGGLAREWAEEMVADWPAEPRLVGLLNDDADPVGAVHLGVVFRAEAAGRPVRVRETDKLEGAFVRPSEVLGVYDRLETWSSLLFDYLLGRVPGLDAGSPRRMVG